MGPTLRMHLLASGHAYLQLPPPQGPIHASIEALDRRGMQLIEAQDAPGFAAYLRATGNTICGRHPTAVLLHALAAYHAAQPPAPRLRVSGAPLQGHSRRCAAVVGAVGHVCLCLQTSSSVGRAAQLQPSPTPPLQLRFTKYAQSQACTTPADSSVSYAAAVVLPEGSER